jgi:bifunctional DNA-binding transcriptional regulator/antitoxin component of YhaV-PrlF toxin-antitoxin module
MKTAPITTGGQISIPAEVRNRWRVHRVAIEDLGDRLVLRPVPADPIGAAVGSLAGPGPSSDQMRATLRGEEASADHRRVADSRLRRSGR